MSGGGKVDVVTEQDEIVDDKVIEDNASLKELVIELRKVIEYLKVITGEDLC